MTYSGQSQRIEVIANSSKVYQAHAHLSFLSKNLISRSIIILLHDEPIWTVQQIQDALYLGQSDVSQVLARLRQIGVVEYERIGKEHHYSIVWERWHQILRAIKILAR